jgi:hypothetical protein
MCPQIPHTLLCFREMRSPSGSALTPSSALPPESPAERIREQIASLPDSPIKAAFLNSIPAALSLAAAPFDFGGLASALAAVGGGLGAWLTGGRQAEWNRRFEEILWTLTEEVARLEQLGYKAEPSAAWAETVFNLLPLALSSMQKEKRERYATLLANGAISPTPKSLEECRTMALILDQLEYPHVELLGRFLSMPGEVKHHGLWGTTREVPLDSSNVELYRDGSLLLRLEGIGLVRLIDTATHSPESLNKVAQFNELARRFHVWITRPAAGPRARPHQRLDPSESRDELETDL